jgi:hypothetical protein
MDVEAGRGQGLSQVLIAAQMLADAVSDLDDAPRGTLRLPSVPGDRKAVAAVEPKLRHRAHQATSWSWQADTLPPSPARQSRAVRADLIKAST